MAIPYELGFGPTEQERWDDMWEALGDLARLSYREANLIGDVVRLGIASNFAHESSPDGVPWEPLAPRTQQERREGIDVRGIPFRVGASHPILVRTHDLMRSFTDAMHPRHIFEVDRAPSGLTEITLSAEDDPETPDRIKTLHSGGYPTLRVPVVSWTGGGYVPARPFVGISDQYEEQLYEQARRVLFQRLERI